MHHDSTIGPCCSSIKSIISFTLALYDDPTFPLQIQYLHLSSFNLQNIPSCYIYARLKVPTSASTYLPTCTSIYLPTSESAYLPKCASIYLTTSASTYLRVHLSIYVSIRLFWAMNNVRWLSVACFDFSRVLTCQLPTTGRRDHVTSDVSRRKLLLLIEFIDNNNINNSSRGINNNIIGLFS